MPLYIYKKPDSEEWVEVVQGMNDEHVYFDEDGLEWKRVFTVPNAGMDTQLDPFNKKKFVEKTKGIKTFGEAWDISKEMSQEREAKTGQPDKVKEKAEKRFYYAKKERMTRKEPN